MIVNEGQKMTVNNVTEKPLLNKGNFFPSSSRGEQGKNGRNNRGSKAPPVNSVTFSTPTRPTDFCQCR